jgi:hypothetical protein
MKPAGSKQKGARLERKVQSENEERWLWVPGFEDHYQVSDFGRVRSFKAKASRLLKPGISSNGYPLVVLCGHGKPASKRVHALVMLAFCGRTPEGKEICHNDGDKTNNMLTNLRFGTRSENLLDSYKHGSHPTQLCWLDVWLIRNCEVRNIRLAEFFGVSPSTITSVRNRNTWQREESNG